MEEVNEKSTYIVAVEFKDETGTTVSPDSLTYRLDDESSGEELIEDTVVASPGTVYSINILPTVNVILNDDKRSEIKVLTVSFIYSTTKSGTAEYKYRLMNLKYLE